MTGVPASCTQTVGPCLCENQARISNLDARCLCTGSLNVSGPSSLSDAKVQALVVESLTVESLTSKKILDNPSIQKAQLGSPSYTNNPEAILLNGQQLQASMYSMPGLIPLSLANGSVIVMGLNNASGGSIYALDWRCNLGTSYYFINMGAAFCTLVVSTIGTINTSTGGASPTCTVSANQRGVVFKYAPTQWAVLMQ